MFYIHLTAPQERTNYARENVIDMVSYSLGYRT